MMNEECQSCSDSGICSGCHSLTPAAHILLGSLFLHSDSVFSFVSQFFRAHIVLPIHLECNISPVTE
jgi:hypothetical protein